MSWEWIRSLFARFFSRRSPQLRLPETSSLNFMVRVLAAGSYLVQRTLGGVVSAPSSPVEGAGSVGAGAGDVVPPMFALNVPSVPGATAAPWVSSTALVF